MDIIESKPTKENYNKFLGLETNFDDVKYFNSLLKYLKDDRSYVRVRSFRLLTKLYKHQIFEEELDEILMVLNDKIAINIRQYLHELKILLLYRPDLEDKIIKEIKKINIKEYKESMQGLIEKDIKEITEV